jgi:TolB-like protein/class 3 adenylate cyclase
MTTRRLAAILAADVVGFSKLIGEDEAGALAALREIRKGIVNPVLAEHGGRIFKLMGDGMLAEFPSAVQALRAAIGIQEAMRQRNAGGSSGKPIEVRIGVHQGDVVVEGSDLLGDGVNIAARLEGLAEPNGICISGRVHEDAAGKIAIRAEDMGEQTLKNIARPVRVYQVSVGSSQPSESVGSESKPALPLPDKPSIAVLPFTNLSGDPDQDYFADGVVEDIIMALCRFERLFVIARNSSFAYKGRAVDVKTVGRELGVRYVLEGSLRKAGNRVRLAGQLVDTSTGAHLWANRFDGQLEDIFDLQDQVTASVVGAVAPKLVQAEIERALRKPTESLDAYDFFLRGMAGIHQWTKEATEEALSNFYRSIDLDPNFASAYGLAARCYVVRKTFGDRSRAVVETDRLARRAADLGKDDALALCTAGIALAYVVGDLDDGAAFTDRALVLNPNLAWAWLFSGWVKVWRGEPEVAIERVGRALRLSPQDPHMFSMQSAIACAHFIAGRYAEALSWAEAAMRVRPTFLLAFCAAAASGAIAGRPAEAEKALARLCQLDPELRISSLKDLMPNRRREDFERWVEGLRKAGLPE